MGVLGLSYKKIIAFFMLFLIISLTPVFAFNYNIHGSMNQDRRVAANENFQADISEINGQIQINVSGELSNCPCLDDYSQCTCYFAPQTTPGYKIINAIENPSIPHGMQYFLDAVAPEIIVNSSIDDNIVTVNYTLTDSTGSPDLDCTGIYDIKIYVNQNLKYTEIIDTETCTISDSVSFEIEPVTEIDITLSVRDLVGNVNEEDSNSLTMDAIPPVVIGTFDIYQGQTKLDKIALNPSEIPIVDVVFIVQEQELLVNHVYGDLSDFNNIPIQNIGYENKLANCILKQEEMYECRFKNIKFHPVSSTLNLPVKLIDSQANSNELTLIREYSTISSKNEVIHIGPDKATGCEGNTCFVGSNANVQVKITGTEDTSFSQLHVPIKIRQLSNYDVSNPYKCEEFEGEWTCYYNFPVISNSGETKYIYIDNTASDNYGKKLTGLSKSSVKIDTNKPVINNESIVYLVNNKEVQDYCLTSFDSLSIQLEATDDLSSELIIRANTLSTLMQSHESRCEKQGGVFVCDLKLDNFVSAAEEDKTITIYVYDLAGNFDIYNFPINLCVSDIETIPNLVNSISVESDNSPEIDRSVASYHYWKTFVDLKFNLATSSQGDVKLIDYEITHCEAYDVDAGADYVYGSGRESYYFFNKDTESGQAAILIGGQDILADEVDLICQVAFEGRIGTTYYRRTQVKNFILELDFEGVNINSPDENVIKEIDKIKEDIEKINEDIKWRKALDTTMGILCGTGKIIATINSAIQALNLVFKALCTMFTGGGDNCDWFHEKVAQPFLSVTERYAWPGGNFYSNILNIFKGKGYPIIGITVKSACFIYECKYYDVNELVDFATRGLFDDLFKAKEINVVDKEGVDVGNRVDEIKNDDGTGDLDLAKKDKEEKGNLINYMKENKEGIIKDITLIKPHDTNSEDIYESNFKLQKKNYAETKKGISSLSSEYKKLNLKKSIEGQYLHDSIDLSTWIVNPYKSTKYDDACLKATLFNLEKEKQIKCLYINCLQDAKNGAFDKELCSQYYDYQDCLYLTGAQERLNDEENTNYFINSLLEATAASLLGTAISSGFQALCSEYYDMGESKPYDGEGEGLKQWLCAAAVIYVNTNELISSWNSIYSTFQHNDLGDNCKELGIE